MSRWRRWFWVLAAVLLFGGCWLVVANWASPGLVLPPAQTTSPPTTFAPPPAPTSTPAPSLTPVRCRVVGGNRPDPKCTPGDHLVATAAQVCASGWAAAHRNVSASIRAAVLAAYGNPPKPFELDHLIPLELGGSNDPRNLWPQPGAIPNLKDRVEDRLHQAVCAGTLDLAVAQRRMAADWTTA